METDIGQLEIVLDRFGGKMVFLELKLVKIIQEFRKIVHMGFLYEIILYYIRLLKIEIYELLIKIKYIKSYKI